MSSIPQDPHSLLTEYQVAVGRIQQFAASAWQSASIVIGAALGGAGYAATRARGISDWLDMAAVIAACVLTIWIVRCWRGLYDRWDEFTAIYQYRMQEIESILGLRLNRYVEYMDKEGTTRVQAFAPGCPHAQSAAVGSSERGSFERARKYLSQRKLHRRAGHALIARITGLTQVAWLVVLVYCVVRFLLATAI